MRIVHALHGFPPETQGGTERYVHELAQRQARAGHAVRVLCGSERASAQGGLARAERSAGAGFELVRLPAPERLGGRALVDPALPGRIAEVLAELEREPPQLVHVHHWHNLALGLVRALDARGWPCVLTLHDHFSSCARFFRLVDDAEACAPEQELERCAVCLERDAPGQLGLLRELVEQRARALRGELAAARARIAVSRDQRALLERIPAFAGLEFTCLPAPWAPAPVRAAAARARPAGVELSIANWGGLVRGKGLAVAAQACARLAAPARVELVHYGPILDADFARELRERWPGLRLELRGPYAAAQLGAIAASHDLAVFPSFFLETHGFAVDEALLAGLPVLVSDRGAPRERIGARGRVFPAGDAAALAALLAEFLADPAALARLRAGAHAPAVGFDEHLRALDGIYRRACGSPRGESL